MEAETAEVAAAAASDTAQLTGGGGSGGLKSRDDGAGAEASHDGTSRRKSARK